MANGKGRRELISIETIRAMLKGMGWPGPLYRPYEDGADEHELLTMWPSVAPEHEPRLMAIRLIHELNCLSFHVPSIAWCPRGKGNQKRLANLLTALGWINGRTVLGKSSYDPRDGEVRFSLAMPIDGGKLDQRQFRHCFHVAIAMVEEFAPYLQRLAAGSLDVDSLIAAHEHGVKLKFLSRNVTIVIRVVMDDERKQNGAEHGRRSPDEQLRRLLEHRLGFTLKDDDDYEGGDEEQAEEDDEQ
jgi:hypothetical protein